MKKLLFVIIAQRDVEFFINVANKLKTKYEVYFLSFYEPAEKLLKKNSFKYFVIKKSFFDNIHTDLKKIKQLEKKFNFKFNDFSRHEKLTFNVDENYLKKKCIIYFDLLFPFIKTLKPHAIFQELGGFIAPLSVFYISQNLKIDHFFFEPMFFSKTLGMIKNNLSYKVPQKRYKKNYLFVKDYIKKYHNEKIIVIPIKDYHHFKDFLLTKFFNFTNAKLLLNKIYFKYIERKHQEYDHIYNHCKLHFSRLINSFNIKNLYYRPDFNKKLPKYIYFPFHVPFDYSITVRNPDFVNQIIILENIIKNLPDDVQLWAKEHPASIGSYNKQELKKLTNYENFKLICPKYNSYELIKNSEAIVTINSKVGLEALMQKKKVLVLGESYYLNKNLTFDLKSFSSINRILCKKNIKNFDENIFFFLSSLKKYSFSVELYVNDDENIRSFSQMINLAFDKKRFFLN